MRKLQSYISIFVLLVFALTSVMQFHNHDCYGNIYIHLTTIEDLVIGQSTDLVEYCSHNDENESHHHDDESCSMHLGCYKGSEQNSLKILENIQLLYGLLHLNQIIIENKIIDIIVADAVYYDDYINNVLKSISSFRAPPRLN